uniref:glycosyltransferase domain-containing protein n=1 Tax=Hafnia alvei TaxID=569 RepID=UPI00266BEAB7|nr:glycosyltransferase domain-containing protein [Hafnia alvei]
MNEFVIYTAVTGCYDKIKPLSFVNPNFDYLCFTDYKFKGLVPYPWKQIRLPESHWTNKDLARYCKMNVHELLPQYKGSMWIDGNIDIIADVEKLIVNSINKSSISSYQHWCRDNIYQEINECAKIGFDNIFVLKKQIKFYHQEGFVSDELFETNVLIRDHCDKCFHQLSQLWWEQYTKYGKRDQYSLTYVVWKMGAKINNMGPHDPRFINKYFSYSGHTSISGNKKIKIEFRKKINKIFNRLALLIVKI